MPPIHWDSEAKVMEEEMREADKLLSNFSTKLDEVEDLLQPLLKNLDTVRTASSESKDDFDALSLARLHITLCYTLNSLFCMYLRTQGVDPVSHPIMEHIDRAQDAFLRLRKVEAGIGSTKNPKPKRNVKEHIARTNLALEKLALVVFPEEYQLLQALRNREKHKQFENDKDDEKRGHDKLARNGEAPSKVSEPFKESDEEDSDVDDAYDEESSPARISKREKANGTSSKETEPAVRSTQKKVDKVECGDEAKCSAKRMKKAQKVDYNESVASTPGFKDSETTELFDSTLTESKSYVEKERSHSKDKKHKKLKKLKKRENRIDQSDSDLQKESKGEAGTKDKKKKKKSKREESNHDKQTVEKSKKKRKRSDAEKSSASVEGKESDPPEKRSKKKAKE